jgi:hypothetical protein
MLVGVLSTENGMILTTLQYMKTIRNFQIKHNSQVPNLIYYFIAEIL